MKKYALLLLLCCVTLLLGGMVYHTAVQQTVTAEKTVEVEDKGGKTSFGETTRELARESGKSLTHYLFTLIYK
jgi:hypothetical protein